MTTVKKFYGLGGTCHGQTLVIRITPGIWDGFSTLDVLVHIHVAKFLLETKRPSLKLYNWLKYLLGFSHKLSRSGPGAVFTTLHFS
jgi:hypothetical protein